MQIVTDTGMDLTDPQMQGIDINVIPLLISMEGRTYRSEIDIHKDSFYQTLNGGGVFPTTSQPSPTDFKELYQSIAHTDRDIFSIHMSSKLSGTFNSARLGANEVPEANITLIDTQSASAGTGWVVEHAARAIKAGWSREEIMPLLKLINDKTEVIFTPATLKFLIHGGRVGHLRGLVGSIMDIKPIIGFDDEGKLAQIGTMRTMKKAIMHLVDVITQRYEPGTALRVQIMHASANPEAISILNAHLEKTFDCTFLPTGVISTLIGAHTGPGLVGLAFAPEEVFTHLPWDKERPY